MLQHAFRLGYFEQPWKVWGSAMHCCFTTHAPARSLDEVDPELLRTFDRLGIPLAEQKRLSNVAVDAVFDSVSIATTFKKELREHGIIFCSISEAVRDFPDLIRKHLGSVVRRWAGAFLLFVEPHAFISCCHVCMPLRAAHARSCRL